MMKVYQTVQKNLSLMGYSPDKRPFNKKQIKIGVEMALCIGLHIMYLVHVASTPREYMEAIFQTSVVILIFISFISTVLKMDIIFIFIDKIEILVNDSKLSSINQTICLALSCLLYNQNFNKNMF